MRTFESLLPEKAVVVRFSDRRVLSDFVSEYQCTQDINDRNKYYLYLGELTFTREDLEDFCGYLGITMGSSDAFILEDADTLIATID